MSYLSQIGSITPTLPINLSNGPKHHTPNDFLRFRIIIVFLKLFVGITDGVINERFSSSLISKRLFLPALVAGIADFGAEAETVIGIDLVLQRRDRLTEIFNVITA